jgi:hypothetical protein
MWLRGVDFSSAVLVGASVRSMASMVSSRT